MIERITHWDTAAVLWMCGKRREAVDAAMLLFTRIGDGVVWAVLGVLLAVFGHRGMTFLLVLAVAFGIELAVYAVAKKRVSRTRPFLAIPGVTMLVLPPDEFSFPSGHTAAAFVMATVAGAFFPLLLAVLLPLGVAIGLSRVYLGVHFPSDIVAGAFLGMCSGLLSLALLG